MNSFKTVKIEDINEYKRKTINPLNCLNDDFEMYSVPSYDNNFPEIVKGKEIGSTKQVVESGDVLICKINPRINRIWVVGSYTKFMKIASSEWIVVRNKNINPNYLAWYFRSYKFKQLMASQVTGMGGSLMRAQPKNVISYTVPIPDKNVQDKIVEVLDKAQSLIYKRKQQIEASDELIKSRFVEMFGDVVHSTENVVELKEIADIGSSKRIYANEYTTDGIPFYRSKEIRELGDGNRPSIELFISEDRYYDIKSAYGVPAKGDILIAAIGATIGYMWVIDSDAPFYYKDGNLILISNIKDGNSVFFQEVLKRLIGEYKRQGATGSAQLALTIEKVEKFKVPVPDINLQNQFATFVQQVDKLKFSLQQSLSELENNFDALMQKAFNGELFV